MKREVKIKENALTPFTNTYFLWAKEMNDGQFFYFREVPVSVWIYWGAAKPHVWHYSTYKVQNGLYQHGGQGDTREQRSLEVGLYTDGFWCDC